MKKLKIIEKPYGKRKFIVLFGNERMQEFKTKAEALDFANIYLVPPYTMNDVYKTY